MSVDDFEKRVEWMDQHLESMNVFDISRKEPDIENVERAQVWYFDDLLTHSFFIGTMTGQKHFDIIYIYNLLLDIAISLDTHEIKSIFNSSDPDEIEKFRDESPSFSEEIVMEFENFLDVYDVSPEDLALSFEMDLDELAEELKLDVQDLVENLDIDDLDEFSKELEKSVDEVEDESIREMESGESIGEETDVDKTSFSTDWAAANLRVNRISEKNHSSLKMKLIEIFSEGPLGYRFETNDEDRIHIFRLHHRLFPEEDKTSTQDIYDVLRLVKSSGHHAQHYLRYAFRIRDDIEEDPEEVVFPTT